MKKANAKTSITRVIFVIDESGSMLGLEKDVIAQYNAQLNELRSIKKNTGEEFIVSLYSFSYNYRINEVFINENVDTAQFTDYSPAGGTALYDAIVKATPVSLNNNETCLVIVMTDGGENASTTTSLELRKLINNKNKTDKYTFVALVPMGHSQKMTAIGFYTGNVREWEVERGGVGLNIGTQSVMRGYSTYTVAKAAGLGATKSFFETDMSKVNKSTLKKQNEVSVLYKKLNVDKEDSIKEFVERKGFRYYPGRALYQLSKPESILGKDILIEDKKSGNIYENGRDLLSLGRGTIRVHPGKHETYNIYVRSTSVNRKLVRGTKLLLEK